MRFINPNILKVGDAIILLCSPTVETVGCNTNNFVYCNMKIANSYQQNNTKRQTPNNIKPTQQPQTTNPKHLYKPLHLLLIPHRHFLCLFRKISIIPRIQNRSRCIHQQATILIHAVFGNISQASALRTNTRYQ